MIPGLIAMLSPRSDRWELKVDLIVPARRVYGAASRPVGVMGAGSSAVPHASLRVRVPLDGASLSEISTPKLVYVRLNFFDRDLSSCVSRFTVVATELYRRSMLDMFVVE